MVTTSKVGEALLTRQGPSPATWTGLDTQLLAAGHELTRIAASKSNSTLEIEELDPMEQGMDLEAQPVTPGQPLTSLQLVALGCTQLSSCHSNTGVIYNCPSLSPLSVT